MAAKIPNGPNIYIPAIKILKCYEICQALPSQYLKNTHKMVESKPSGNPGRSHKIADKSLGSK
jgi:hypothetical protein